MQILKVNRVKDSSDGVKVYAQVEGDEHNGQTAVYNVTYVRRGGKGNGFRGWVCSCPNFILSQVGRNGHCKHIDLLQETYGRHGAGVGVFVPKVGDVVFVTKKANDLWTGKGVVREVFTRRSDATGILPSQTTVSLVMQTGEMKGYSGGFGLRDIEPVAQPTA